MLCKYIQIYSILDIKLGEQVQPTNELRQFWEVKEDQDGNRDAAVWGNSVCAEFLQLVSAVSAPLTHRSVLWKKR